ncbi:hypothetical protein HCN44_009082, partial [Aphidius gifuensis]
MSRRNREYHEYSRTTQWRIRKKLKADFSSSEDENDIENSHENVADRRFFVPRVSDEFQMSQSDSSSLSGNEEISRQSLQSGIQSDSSNGLQDVYFDASSTEYDRSDEQSTCSHDESTHGCDSSSSEEAFSTESSDDSENDENEYLKNNLFKSSQRVFELNSKVATMSSISNVENLSPQIIRRVAKEMTELVAQPPEGIRVIINDDDLTDIQAVIEGPAGTPYTDGHFKVKVALGKDFPQCPPKAFFLTKIFHPNVAKNGEICVNTLKKDWKSDLGIKHILLTVKCLLIVPNAESALNEEAGKMLLEKYDDYSERAKMMTEIHAQQDASSFHQHLKHIFFHNIYNFLSYYPGGNISSELLRNISNRSGLPRIIPKSLRIILEL